MNRALLAALVALAALLVGCGSDASSQRAAADEQQQSGHTTATVEHLDPVPIATDPTPQLPASVTGFDGRQVTVDDASRIVAVDRYGTLAQTVYALGLGDNLVGRSVSAAFPAVEHVTNVTPGGNSLNAEADPRAAADGRTHRHQHRPAGGTGPVACRGHRRRLLRPHPHDGGRQPADRGGRGGARRPRAGCRSSPPAPSRRSPTPRRASADHDQPRIAFLYLRGTALTLLAGPGSGADALIEAIGGEDAGTAAGLTASFVPVTSEAMIVAAPDVILLMTDGLESIGGVDGLENVPGVAQTPAGQNKRVVDMADSVLLSFGPNTGEVVAALAQAVYPEGQ